MAPLPPRLRAAATAVPDKASMSTYADILEAWGEGYQFSGMIILMLIVACNLRRHVLLHKLILFEQFLALWHATFIFANDPVYGWYIGTTVVLLYASYFMHNLISWMKIRPFLSKRQSSFFVGTLLLVQPYWIFEAWTVFARFNGLPVNDYQQVRPYEILAREPWWVFTTIYLVRVIKTRYNFSFWELIRSSPRFAILILCMILSIVFAIVDTSVVIANVDNTSGINPYWRISLVFKCASDTIFLDDFRRVLDSLVTAAFQRAGETQPTTSTWQRHTPLDESRHEQRSARDLATSQLQRIRSMVHHSYSTEPRAARNDRLYRDYRGRDVNGRRMFTEDEYKSRTSHDSGQDTDGITVTRETAVTSDHPWDNFESHRAAQPSNVTEVNGGFCVYKPTPALRPPR